MPKAEPWRYEKLTWPEINQAVAARKVVVVPIGSTEQHGPHLPLDVDVVCPVGVACEAARLIPQEVLSCRQLCGYTVMSWDFPGTINIHWENHQVCLDVGELSVPRVWQKIVLPGHGSNVPTDGSLTHQPETDAECMPPPGG
jgi:creatinine amidohydrolase